VTYEIVCENVCDSNHVDTPFSLEPIQEVDIIGNMEERDSNANIVEGNCGKRKNQPKITKTDYFLYGFVISRSSLWKYISRRCARERSS